MPASVSSWAPAANRPAANRPAGDRLELGSGPARDGTSLAPKSDEGPLSRLWGGVRSFFGGAASFVRNFFDHREIWSNPAVPAAPKDPGKLSVVSYNIELGGKHIEAAEAALRELDADVVCLQEASLESAQRLAKNLGYHLAFATTPLKTAGKVVLSRYPVESVEDRAFRSVPFMQRLGAYWTESLKNGKYAETEPLAKRSVLHAQIRVGNRVVDVLDTHLSLKNAQSNAEELQELADLAGRLSRAGHTVVAAGDFNTNFALAGTAGQADAAGRVDTPTDTIAEFRARYPHLIKGNIASPAGKAGADRLAAELQSFWDKAPERAVIVAGEAMPPEQALAELASGSVKPGQGRYLQLLRAVDGISHIGASKRFDNVFVSRDAKVRRAVIDQTSRGSDHQPVLAEIAW